ncbi:ribose ABC transporter permease [Tessaracoccus lubricantis]|uniref:Autoinducer 2 import system permease protein LsrD n=1 Tax=Tessaracoccus lubricantis TaxID=545543 RepID=A0ABP9FF01_9ACTN
MRLLLTNRTVLLLVLLVLVVGIFTALSATGVIPEGYNSDYLASSMINLVPLTMLALAQLLVIVSGNGGIDLSVGAIVSLAGMLFGFMYGIWGWPLLVSILATVVCGALFGMFNGFLVAYLGYPPLIVTLATYYAMWSISLVINNQQPINTPPLQDLYGLSRAVELPLIGQYLPLVPLGVFLFMIPTVLIVWFVTAKTTYGRELYAIGTNDTAAMWAGINTKLVRMLAYVGAGAISGLVAVVTASQFASARPDQGVSGNGMALPAITMAVLGGVAIMGGIGTVMGVLLAALLITWLNAGILLAFSGNAGSQLQLFALGAVLVGAALLNGITTRRYSGSNN